MAQVLFWHVLDPLQHQQWFTFLIYFPKIVFRCCSCGFAQREELSRKITRKVSIDTSYQRVPTNKFLRLWTDSLRNHFFVQITLCKLSEFKKRRNIDRRWQKKLAALLKRQLWDSNCDLLTWCPAEKRVLVDPDGEQFEIYCRIDGYTKFSTRAANMPLAKEIHIWQNFGKVLYQNIKRNTHILAQPWKTRFLSPASFETSNSKTIWHQAMTNTCSSTCTRDFFTTRTPLGKSISRPSSEW